MVHVYRGIIPRAAIMRAFVKRQEESVVAFQTCRHIDLILTHREMHQRTALERQQRFWLLGDRVHRQARGTVLLHRIVYRLLKFRLQLQRRNRDTVDE